MNKSNKKILFGVFVISLVGIISIVSIKHINKIHRDIQKDDDIDWELI